VSHELLVDLELRVEDLERLFLGNAHLVIVHNAGVEEVGLRGVGNRVLGADDLAVAVLGSLSAALGQQLLGGPELLRSSADYADAQAREQGQVIHEHAVEAVGAIAQPHERAVGKLFALRLALDHRDEVGDDLRGMMLLLAAKAVGLELGAGHAADNRHGGVRDNLVDDALRKAANHDGVSHARNDCGGLSDVFLARAGMQGAAVEEHCVAAELLHSGLEAHASTG